MRVIRHYQGWSDDARAAMAASPAYFSWWDRWKTGFLVVTLIGIAVVKTR